MDNKLTITLEDKVRKQLGDLHFTVIALQHKLEEVQQELEDLKKVNNVRSLD